MTDLTTEQAAKLYKRKTMSIIADVIIGILLIVGIIFLASHFRLAKEIESGELNACHICQEKYNAICSLPGYDKTYWSKSELEAAQNQSAPINFSNISLS